MVAARVALGSTLLLSGDFSRGWVEYEARWQVAGRSPDRGFTQPMWDGGDLQGRTILLHAEQGLGDTLQFIRYVKMIRAKGAGQVIVLCPSQLKTLLAGQAGIDEVATDPAAAAGIRRLPLSALERAASGEDNAGDGAAIRPIYRGRSPLGGELASAAGRAGPVNKHRNRLGREHWGTSTIGTGRCDWRIFAPLAMEMCRFFSSAEGGAIPAQARRSLCRGWRW